jgi:hypothetical protein
MSIIRTLRRWWLKLQLFAMDVAEVHRVATVRVEEDEPEPPAINPDRIRSTIDTDVRDSDLNQGTLEALGTHELPGGREVRVGYFVDAADREVLVERQFYFDGEEVGVRHLERYEYELEDRPVGAEEVVQETDEELQEFATTNFYDEPAWLLTDLYENQTSTGTSIPSEDYPLS